MQEIQSRVARELERIGSLEVTYNSRTTSNLSPEKLRTIPEYMNQMILPQDQWHEAFKGQKRYRRQIQSEQIKYLAPVDENGLFVPSVAPADAPPAIKENQKKLKEEYDRAIASMKAIEARGAKIHKRDPSLRDRGELDETRVYNGKTLWIKKPMTPRGDRYEVWSSGSKPNWFQVSTYLGAIGLHVPDPKGEDVVRKAQAMFQVATWINDRSYMMESMTEVVDGATCVILKGSLNSIDPPGYPQGDITDRLWLDRDHGLVLRKREMARDGRLTVRWVTTDLKEVETGLWLPMTTRHEQFAIRPIPELGEKPVLIEEIRVQSVAVNKVPDDRFDMTPKAGDSVDDLRARF
jgi:hypothetical protein